MNCSSIQITTNQMTSEMPALMVGRRSSVTNEATFSPPPPLPVRNPKSEGMIGSLRMATLALPANAVMPAMAPKNAVPIQNRFVTVTQIRYRMPSAKKLRMPAVLASQW